MVYVVPYSPFFKKIHDCCGRYDIFMQNRLIFDASHKVCGLHSVMYDGLSRVKINQNAVLLGVMYQIGKSALKHVSKNYALKTPLEKE